MTCKECRSFDIFMGNMSHSGEICRKEKKENRVERNGRFVSEYLINYEICKEFKKNDN